MDCNLNLCLKKDNESAILLILFASESQDEISDSISNHVASYFVLVTSAF